MEQRTFTAEYKTILSRTFAMRFDYLAFRLPPKGGLPPNPSIFILPQASHQLNPALLIISCCHCISDILRCQQHISLGPMLLFVIVTLLL